MTPPKSTYIAAAQRIKSQVMKKKKNPSKSVPVPVNSPPISPETVDTKPAIQQPIKRSEWAERVERIKEIEKNPLAPRQTRGKNTIKL